VLDGCGVVEDAGVEDAGVEDATEELGLLEEGSLLLTTEEVLADCSEEDLADELSSVLGSSSNCGAETDSDELAAASEESGSLTVQADTVRHNKPTSKTMITFFIYTPHFVINRSCN